MYAGLLKEPIEIYDMSSTINEYGERKNELVLTYSTRAKVSHNSGSRTVIDQEIQTPYVKTFVMRVYVPVKDDSWIRYEGYYYRVTSIDTDKDLQQKIVIAEIVNE